LDIDPTNENVTLWMQTFLCPCVRYFGTNHAIDTCDSFLGRAFVSAASNGHLACMYRVAKFWSAKPSDEIKRVLKAFPSGVLDVTFIHDFLQSNVERFGLTMEGVATRPISPMILECSHRLFGGMTQCEAPDVSFSCKGEAAYFSKGGRADCGGCGRQYNATTKSLHNGGIKGVCRECYHLRYMACFHCLTQQAHPTSIKLQWLRKGTEHVLVPDVSKMACASCVPPLKLEPLVKASHFRAASGKPLKCDSVQEPARKRIRSETAPKSDDSSDESGDSDDDDNEGKP